MSSKVRFHKIPIGAEFELGIDADGYEPFYYKVSESEAYQTHGNGQGLRHTFDPDDLFYLTGKMVQISQTVTEVERVAITLLHNARVVDHPGLSTWVEAMGTNANEMRHLDDYLLETNTQINDVDVSWAEALRRAGFIVPTKEFDRDNSTWSAIFDKSVYLNQDDIDEETDYWAEWNKIILLLADALRDYRVAGRPSGNQTHKIHGMGGPLLNIQTSLAAAIAEYHQRIVNLYEYNRHYSVKPKK